MTRPLPSCNAAWNAPASSVRLLRLGAVAGDEVRIMDIAFEFEPAGWGDEEFDNIIDREG